MPAAALLGNAAAMLASLPRLASLVLPEAPSKQACVALLAALASAAPPANCGSAVAPGRRLLSQRLSTLHVRGAGPAPLALLTERFSHLTALHLHRPGSLSAQQLAALAQRLPQLRCLALCRAAALPADGVAALAACGELCRLQVRTAFWSAAFPAYCTLAWVLYSADSCSPRPRCNCNVRACVMLAAGHRVRGRI